MNKSFDQKGSPKRGYLRAAVMMSVLFLAFFFAACTVNTPLELVDASATAKATALSVTNTSGVPLGTAATFAVLGGTSVTNVGPSMITGDLGVSPGISITGFDLANNTIIGAGVTPGDGIVTGTIYVAGPVAAQAHNDAVIAYAYLMAQVPDADKIYVGVTQLDEIPLLPVPGVGEVRVLTPGVYNFASSAMLKVNGTLYLDFQGNADAVFIFQIGSTLTTMAGSNVVAINNPSTTCYGANVYWAIGSSATIDGDQFLGTVIATTAITMAATAIIPDQTNVSGRLIALGAKLTMASAKTISVCESTGGTTPGGEGDGNGKGSKGKGSKGSKGSGDRVTGGGWFNDDSSSKGSRGHKRDRDTFAISGGIKNGDFWGKLEFDDHQKDGMKIKSTEITGYFIIDAVTRQIDGIARMSGKGSKGSKGSQDSYTFTVIVADNGEPGREDSFALEVFDAGGASCYSTSGILDGGNIQIHTTR